MKKIVLPLLFMPLAALAQVIVPPASQVHMGTYTFGLKESQNYKLPASSIVLAGAPIQPSHALHYANYVTPTSFVGHTTYDLQTNGALAKRLQFYSGGKLSYVWIKSDAQETNYTSRYTGYSSYDGSKWSAENSTSIEYDRNGWPNISPLTVGTSTYEVLTSHFAAAGSNNYAGGLFIYQNSGIGNTDFKQATDIDATNNRDSTKNLLWPRTASSGDNLYTIGVYENDYVQAGVRNPVVFFKYNATNKFFEVKNMVLPGYDNTRYGNGSADEYALDARGNYVAVLIGGAMNDLALWKSSDNGKTWTKTIIDSFGPAPYDSRVDTPFDTTMSNDGSGTVTLDNNGVAHVTWSPMRVINQTQGDSSYSYFGDNSGISYWNDKDQKKITVGGAIDYDHDGKLTISAGNTDATMAGYSGHNWCTYSNTSFDDQGHIFVVYSAPHETDFDINAWNFRHIYVAAFDGSKWLDPQDIMQTWQEEDVFATVSPTSDGSKLNMVFMRDPTPGMFPPGSTGGTSQSIGTDTMYYAGVSISDILAGKVGLINLGINNASNDAFTLAKVFPNPASTDVNIALDLKKASTVTVTMSNMLGQQLATQNYSNLPTGNNRLDLDVNALPAGMYICNITAGGYTTTQQINIAR